MVLAGLLGAADVVSLASPTPSDQIGPPLGILMLDAALGVVSLVCVVIAWRTRSRGAIRIAAGTRIISALTAVPAFFAGPAAPVVVLVSVLVVLTVVSISLMLAPAPRPSVLAD